jgi:hypothetical protein
MNASKDYFIEQITEALTKALGLPVSRLALINGNEIQVIIGIEGQGADTPFWKAVLEHCEPRQTGAVDRSLPVSLAAEETVSSG